MVKPNKMIVYSLIGAFAFSITSPAFAGYYKTVYVEDTPNQTIIINQPVQEKVIVEEKIVTQPVVYQSSPVAEVLGIGALVGSVILGVSMHNHHKKMSKKHHPKSQPKRHHKPSHAKGRHR